jgi:RNA polymerase-binding transcription factor DksA
MTAAHSPALVIRLPAWRASRRSAARWRLRDQRRASLGRTDAVAVLPMSSWRRVLEKRWQARLLEVTELSVAFYETGERTGRGAGGTAAGRELRRLQRRTVAARRALADTEEALGRLAAGSYGQCEQCAADIPARWLQSRPEARYCPRCSPPRLTRAAVRRDAAATAGIRPTRRPF